MAEFNIPKSYLKPGKYEQNKDKLKSYIRNWINKEKKAGTPEKEIRKQLKPFMVGDKKVEIQKFSKFYNNEATNIGLQYDADAYRARKNIREEYLKRMTDKTGAAEQVRYGAGNKARGLLKGQQDHHMRFRTLFQPFYEGLDEADAEELTRWFAEGESPLGNVAENLEGIDSDLHQELQDSLHVWAKDNQIDVKPYTKEQWSKFDEKTKRMVPNQRNIKTNPKTGERIAAGGADGEIIDTGQKGLAGPDLPPDMKARKTSSAKFPNFEGTSLDNRKNAARLWLNTIEEPLMDKTAEIMARQDARYSETLPDYKGMSKDEWSNKFKGDAKNVASRSRILEDNPGLTAADLDSPEVSSTLGNRMKLQNLDLKKLGNIGGKLNTADSVAQIIGGNPLGGGLGLIMQQPGFHKQIGKALGKTFAKSGAKLLPGVGMTMGTLEAAGYASQGRLTQSGIATFSALVGEVPGIGDFLSAGADLLNTGIDIATGNLGKVEMEIDDVKEFDGIPIRAARALRGAT